MLTKPPYFDKKRHGSTKNIYKRSKLDLPHKQRVNHESNHKKLRRVDESRGTLNREFDICDELDSQSRIRNRRYDQLVGFGCK
jgi:hypothetical protein